MNFAILGAGHVAEKISRTINLLRKSGNDEVSLYAVASRNIEKAKAFAEKYQIQNAYGSYEELVSDPRVDLVYIATPHPFHAEHARLAIDHGRNVLCEKPFTVNAKEAREIFQLAKEHDVLITEAIWTRYQPMRRIIREKVFSGVIGDPVLISANLCYDMIKKDRIAKAALAGGALLDVGIYTLNFAEMIFGRPDHVEASSVRSEQGIDLTSSYDLSWKDGKMAVLHSSALCPSDRRGMIAGTKGYITVDNINNPEALHVFNSDHEEIETIPAPEQATGYEYEILEAMQCIRDGKKECPSMPHEETVHILELMDQIRAQLGIRYPFED